MAGPLSEQYSCYFGASPALGSSQTLGRASPHFPPGLTASLHLASCALGTPCSGSAQSQPLEGEAGWLRKGWSSWALQDV